MLTVSFQVSDNPKEEIKISVGGREPGISRRVGRSLGKRMADTNEDIGYLYNAGELASNRGDTTVREEHVQEAEAVIECKRVKRGIRNVGYDYTGSFYIDCNRFA